jgi:MscS family membrane protein
MNWEALTDWRQLLVWPGPDTEPAVWVTQVFAVVLCTVTVNFILMRVIDIIDHFSRETHNLWDDALLDSLRIPIRLLLWVVGRRCPRRRCSTMSATSAAWRSFLSSRCF